MSGNSALKDVAVTWPECGHTAGICCKKCFDEQAAELAELRRSIVARDVDVVFGVDDGSTLGPSARLLGTGDAG